MKITTKELRRCDLVTVEGRVDSSTVETLAQTLASITEARRYKIVLNMKNVTFVSSAGFGELIATQKTCHHLMRGDLVLAEVPEQTREALNLAGLTPLFKIFESETEAVGGF